MSDPRQARPRLGRLLGIGAVVLIFAFYAAFVGEMMVVGWDMLGRYNQYLLDYARQFAGGALPYRDFAFEYPPLALIMIVLPYLLGGTDLAQWSALLAAENLVVVIATAGCLAYLVRRGWSARGTADTVLIYILLIAATPIVFIRWDSLPALLTVIALCAMASGRSAASGIALALGGLDKLYPLLLVPVVALPSFLSRKWRQLGAIVAGSVVTVAIGLGALIALVGPTLGLSFLTYHADRGYEIESVPATFGLLAHAFGGAEATTFNAFGSWQLQSPLVDSLGWLWLAIAALMAAAVAVSAIVQYRRELRIGGSVSPLTQIGLLMATILVFMLGYRVLSPQYVIWLLPFAALLPRGKVVVTAMACLLTLYVYPFGAQGLIDLDTFPILSWRCATQCSSAYSPGWSPRASAWLRAPCSCAEAPLARDVDVQYGREAHADPAEHGVARDAPRIYQRADRVAAANVDAGVLVVAPDQHVARLCVGERA